MIFANANRDSLRQIALLGDKSGLRNHYETALRHLRMKIVSK